MIRFLAYFVLEFAIIFIIASAAYWFMKVPFNFFQITLSSVTGGAVIAWVLVKTKGKDCSKSC